LSVNELLHNQYEPVKWIIPDILPEGLTLFCAAPKIGKSMVALAIALRMARRVHGGIEGETLYLSLDDVSERRLQSRTRSLLQGKEVEDRIFFATESRNLDTGLIEQLEQWMSIRPATALIVIDVYGTVKPKRVGDDIYKNDYNALNNLRTFATKHRVAVILVHHTRKKRDDEDWINNINGSNGLAGACDTLWYLKRARGSQEMTLCIDGREDGLASQVALTLEDLDLPWIIDGVGTPQDLNQSEQMVIRVLQEQSSPLSPKQVAELAQLKNTRMLIRRMLAKNLIIQTTYGLYTVAPESNRVTKSNRVTIDEKAVTLCDTAPQADVQARVTKNSKNACYSVTLTHDNALQADPQRVTKSNNDITLCYSVTLENSVTECVPEEPAWFSEILPSQSNRVTKNEESVTLYRSAPQAIPETRATKKSENICHSVTLVNKLPSQADPQRVTKSNSDVTLSLCHSVALEGYITKSVPEEPKWFSEIPPIDYTDFPEDEMPEYYGAQPSQLSPEVCSGSYASRKLPNRACLVCGVSEWGWDDDRQLSFCANCRKNESA
jgi:hypothetical protein